MCCDDTISDDLHRYIRNAIGAHSGSYSIYKALAAAIGAVDPAHRPDYTNTEPAFPVPPQPSWFDPKQIVSMDPWGHLAPWEFKDRIDGGRFTTKLSHRRCCR